VEERQVTGAEPGAARERLRLSRLEIAKLGITEEEVLAAMAEDDAREKRTAAGKLARQ
jgi:hypothetical protein